MATYSAMMARHVIENGFQVMAIQIMSVCQALDLLDEDQRKLLGSKTEELYKMVRDVTPAVTEDVPQAENIAKVTDLLRANRFEL